MAVWCRERGSHLNASDEAWVYWEREQDDILGVHRLGFTVSCDRKMPFPLFFTAEPEQSDACLQLHT